MNGIIDILKKYKEEILNLKKTKNDSKSIIDKRNDLVNVLNSKVNSLSLSNNAISKIKSFINSISHTEDPDTIIKLINELIGQIKAYLDKHTTHNKGKGM